MINTKTQLSEELVRKVHSQTCAFCSRELILNNYWDGKKWSARHASCTKCMIVFYATEEGLFVDEIGWHNLHLI